MPKNSLTVGQLRQAIAGKPDDTPVMVFESFAAIYTQITRAKVAKVLPDAHDFLVDSPVPELVGTVVLSLEI